jgi:uncharacterized protein (UPF0332 family)
MTFDPGEFLRVAHELSQHNYDEASLRTAVNRAYYSVFLIARDKVGLRGSQRHIHGQVIGRLRPIDRAAADQLDKLETLRGEADYELMVEDPHHRDWKSNWTNARGFAAHILRRLQKLGS